VRNEDLVALVPHDLALSGRVPIALRSLAEHPFILPPAGNPLRDEVESAASAEDVELRVPIEVEGIRLIADLVAAGAGVSIVPETAVPPDNTELRSVRIASMPPRRLAVITAHGVQLSLADQAVIDVVRRILREPDDTHPVLA
jgi:DNA-binding transcriptional LysR family regulator